MFAIVPTKNSLPSPDRFFNLVVKRSASLNGRFAAVVVAALGGARRVFAARLVACSLFFV